MSRIREQVERFYAVLWDAHDATAIPGVLHEDVTVAGNALARVFASCDCRDFDLWFRLYDVHPDGRVINVRSPGAEVMRVSYRDIANGRKPLVPGEVYEVRMDGLIFAHTFMAGHRLRAQISASFAPHLSGNSQTGDSEIHSAASQVAEIAIHHGDVQFSRLDLPVIE